MSRVLISFMLAFQKMPVFIGFQTILRNYVKTENCFNYTGMENPTCILKQH